MAPKGPFIKSRRITWTPEGLDLDGSNCTRDNVLQAVCFHLNMPEWMLLKKSRKQEIVRARHIAQYFLSMNTKMPVTKIAEFTGVDHSTIQHSVRKVEGYIQIYPQFNDTVFTIAFYIKWLNQLDMEITRHEITHQQIRRLYFLLDQLGIRHLKNDLVMDASDGRTERARELKNIEMNELLSHLDNMLKEVRSDSRPHKLSFQRMDRMRKRILSICYSIGWTRFNIQKRRHEVDMERLEAWLLKYGYLHKPLNDYTYMELPALVTQAERVLLSTLDEKPARP